MSRRASLPGADELFRRTSDVEPEPAPVAPVGASASAAGVSAPSASAPTAAVASVSAAAPLASAVADTEHVTDGSEVTHVRPTARRRARNAGDRRPSGRERHEEKITVYVSPEELVDLEQAKLILRAQHGLAVDRGRIVREALAMLIADLDSKGDDSILVRRLRGL